MIVACVLLLAAFISKWFCFHCFFINDLSLILRERQRDDRPFTLCFILSQKSGLLKSVLSSGSLGLFS